MQQERRRSARAQHMATKPGNGAHCALFLIVSTTPARVTSQIMKHTVGCHLFVVMVLFNVSAQVRGAIVRSSSNSLYVIQLVY